MAQLLKPDVEGVVEVLFLNWSHRSLRIFTKGIDFKCKLEYQILFKKF